MLLYRNRNKYVPVTAFCALVGMLLLIATTTMQAQTTTTPPPPPQAKLALRAMNRDDIAANKLPSTTSLTGGLTTVGLGTAVHLEALLDSAVAAGDILGVQWAITTKPSSSAVTLVDSPLALTMPTYEPSNKVKFQVADRKLFRADVAGQYIITASISTSAGSVNTTVTLAAARYVGIKTCSACHSGAVGDQAMSWAKTGHANLFKEGLNGVASDHYSGSCIGCHTVGYDTDPLAVNGGFDDVAADLKWTFPTVLKEGVFDAIPDALKNVGAITCENCHGPGSLHASTARKELISVSMDSGTCGMCHGALTNHSKTAQFNNSRHAVATTDPSGAGREGCVGCHTGTGFIDRVKNVSAPRTDYVAINCQTCHEPHGKTAPAENAHLVRNLESVTLKNGTVITNGGAGKLCMNCHMSRQNGEVYAATTAGTARFGPHHAPQADMLQGVNAYSFGVAFPTRSAHSDAVKDTCVTCHMQSLATTDPNLSKVGGHTFKVGFDPGEGKDPVRMVQACQSCHGEEVTSFDFPVMDYDGDGVIDGAQTEVQHLMDKLALMLPPVGQAKTTLTIDNTWTQLQLEAGYNYLFVMEDKSKGVHNMAYTTGLLKTSIAKLSAAK